LFICQNQEKFGYHGVNSSLINARLKLTNLPRNLDRLADGYEGYQGFGLVELHKKATDRRVTLPALSPKGAVLMSDISAKLRCRAPVVLRKAKEESLLKASSPDDLFRFDDDDFDNIEW
jgi:hypothetical protein